MTDTTTGPEPVGEKVAQRISRHVAEEHRRAAERKLEKAAEAGRAFSAELRPTLEPIIAQILANMPEDHPLRQATELFNSPAPSIFNDILTALLDLIGVPFAVLAVMKGAGQIFGQTALQGLQADYPYAPIPPADLADMMERAIFDENGNATATSGAVINAYDEAKKSGIDPDRLDLLTDDTGEPYGVMEGLALLRRGAITDDQFQDVLYYSRIKNKYYDQVLDLQFSYLSPADAIEIALKGIETEAVARQMFTMAGGLDENWPDLLAAAGNPIGVVNAVNQYYHGVIDLATVQSVIKHSRINPIFEDLALNEHLKWLTATQIHQALKAGSVTPEVATGWLITDGYDAQQAAVFAGSATQEALADSKQLNVSMIKELYAEGTLTQPAAQLALTQLGYSAANANYILGLADAQTQITATKAAVTRLRTQYLAGHITRAQVANDFVSLGVPNKAQQIYLSTWDVEKTGTARTLSEAQVEAAYAKGIMTLSDATARLEAMGYTAADAALVLETRKTAKSVQS